MLPPVQATLNDGDEVWGVAFSPDSQLIASASRDNKVKLWKKDGTLLTIINGHSAGVSAVAFTPDGKTLASASLDKMVILWNLDRVLALDQLLVYGCDWVRNYLRTSAGVEKSDRHLCDHIRS